MTKEVFVPRYIEGVGSVLVPTDSRGRKLVQSLKQHKDKGVMIEVKAARNPKHHRLFFGLIGLVVENAREPITTDAVLNWIKYAVGHTLNVIDHLGETRTVPASISFEKMSQPDFSDFFDASIQAVCNGLLVGSDFKTVKQEVLERVGYD